MISIVQLVSTVYLPDVSPDLIPAPTNDPADFAALVRGTEKASFEFEQKQQEAKKKNALMTERILEVGLVQYTKEQADVERLMKIITLLKANSSGDIRSHMENLEDHFADSPAKNVAEMLDYINAYADAIRQFAPIAKKAQAETLMRSLQKMMAFSDQQALEMMHEMLESNRVSPFIGNRA